MTKHTPTEADRDAAARKVFILERELDISNADHIALYLEANKPLDSHISWLACRIIEAHEIRLVQSQKELLEALEALLAVAQMTTFSDQYPAECERADAAIARARGGQA